MSVSGQTMPPGKPRLTLVVAVTPSLGIGKNGTLPWPRIKTEMAYFARVTKRVPSTAQSLQSSTSKNAVIMGRKTWESIPSKFRPLPGRINVVVSRQAAEIELGLPSDVKDETFAVSSLQDAVEKLRERDCGRVFVIGGGQIYAEALQLREADRVLLSRIKQEYECDTFFPLKFGTGEGDAGNWEMASQAVRDEWIGEENPGGEEWEVEMWTRKQGEMG